MKSVEARFYYYDRTNRGLVKRDVRFIVNPPKVEKLGDVYSTFRVYASKADLVDFVKRNPFVVTFMVDNSPPSNDNYSYNRLLNTIYNLIGWESNDTEKNEKNREFARDNVRSFLSLLRELRRKTVLDKGFAKDVDPMFNKFNDVVWVNESLGRKFKFIYDFSKDIPVINIGVKMGGPNYGVELIESHFTNVSNYDLTVGGSYPNLRSYPEELNIVTDISSIDVRGKIVILDTTREDSVKGDDMKGMSQREKMNAQNAEAAATCIDNGALVVFFKANCAGTIYTCYRKCEIVSYGRSHNLEVFVKMEMPDKDVPLILPVDNNVYCNGIEANMKRGLIRDLFTESPTFDTVQHRYIASNESINSSKILKHANVFSASKFKRDTGEKYAILNGINIPVRQLDYLMSVIKLT